jgi:hypothetical protein
MRERSSLLLAVALLVLLADSAFGASRKPSVPLPPAAQLITIGNSAVPLTGPWKFAPGDSPFTGDSPDWAKPSFDDSHWAAMDLTPPAGSQDPGHELRGFQPGWTALGYPDLSGFAWYRLRIRVADPTQPLRLKMPDDFDDAYQVYFNGQYVGEFGQFNPAGVALYFSLPASFPVPQPNSDGQLVIAIRFYLSPATQFAALDVGGMHQPPVLGLASTVDLIQSTEFDTHLHRNFGDFLGTLLFLLVAPFALWAWLQDRDDRVWLWLFLALLSQAFAGIIYMIGNLSTILPMADVQFGSEVTLLSFAWALWVVFWWQWFRRSSPHWIPFAACLIGAVRMVTTFFVNSPLLGVTLAPPALLGLFNATTTLCQVAECVLLLVILAGAMRRNRTEALLAAPPILLFVLLGFSRLLFLAFHLSFVRYPFGLGVSLVDFEEIFMVLAIGALALRRFLRHRITEELARQSIDQELEQARELQQKVLVPEEINSPAFNVEVQYHAAQIVGGDFFQTVLGPRGSLLIVIGDVSGKGISAAMLVAVVVGAARTRATQSFDPASMLETLNDRLIGRAGGHYATCVVAELMPDGQLRVANAGHPAPYLNGRELELEGSMPLGFAGKLEPVTRVFQLRPGDQLTFITDGVVEARDQSGELFGFDRTRIICNEPIEQIVDRVQQFGQNDDVTVLRVTYTAGRRLDPAAYSALSTSV